MTSKLISIFIAQYFLEKELVEIEEKINKIFRSKELPKIKKQKIEKLLQEKNETERLINQYAAEAKRIRENDG